MGGLGNPRFRRLTGRPVDEARLATGRGALEALDAHLAGRDWLVGDAPTTLGLEGQRRGGVGEPDPANLLELVVVSGEVATGGFHHEIVDGLVDARPRLDEEVFDRIEGARDADLQTGLLGDLPKRLHLLCDVASGVPLGERPMLARRARDGGSRRRAMVDRLHGGRRPRRQTWRSKSSAAPRRRGGAGATERPAVPGTGPVMTTRGRGRPSSGRAPAAVWMERDRPRRLASGVMSGSAGPWRAPRSNGRHRPRAARGAAPSCEPRRARNGPLAEPRSSRRCCDLSGGYGTGSVRPCKGGSLSWAGSGASEPRRRPGRFPGPPPRGRAPPRQGRSSPARPGAHRGCPTSPRAIGPVRAARTPSARASPRVHSMRSP